MVLARNVRRDGRRGVDLRSPEQNGGVLETRRRESVKLTRPERANLKEQERRRGGANLKKPDRKREGANLKAERTEERWDGRRWTQLASGLVLPSWGLGWQTGKREQ